MTTKKKSPTEIQMEAMRVRRNKDSRYSPGPSGINRYSRWLQRRGEAKYVNNGGDDVV
tara:strand:+ start:497 stop:670 length:174 start_codon:yes stop_codon:yes gene_type:complete